MITEIHMLNIFISIIYCDQFVDTEWLSIPTVFLLPLKPFFLSRRLELSFIWNFIFDGG